MSVTSKVHVRFYETDEMGVVHHSNYIRWFEIGRVEYLRSCGITLRALMDDGILFPITEVRAKYLHPAKFDDELEIETTAIKLTPVKMEFEYKIRKVVDNTILVEGFSQNVFTKIATGRIARLPEKFFSKLAT